MSARPRATSLPPLAVLAWGLLLAVCPAAPGAEYLSPQAVVAEAGGQRLYVALATARRVAIFDVKEGRRTGAIALPDNPGGLALSADGRILYVAGAAPQGRIHVVSLPRGQILRALPAGHTPGALVLSPDGRTLFACNRFSHDVSVMDLASGRAAARIPVSREPVGAALAQGGELLFVANFLPAGPADGASSAAVLSVISTRARRVVGEIPLPNGSNAAAAVSASPDGAYIYVVHTLARYQLPTTQVERGWMNTSALSVVRVADRALVNTVLLDDVDRGAANPWDVVCTPDGQRLCVSHAGTHEVSVIERARLHEKLERLAGGRAIYDVAPEEGGGPLTAADVPQELSFLAGMRTRVALSGRGPRGLAVAGRQLYAAEYFSDSLAAVELDGGAGLAASSLPLGPRPRLTAARRGEMLFHDAAQCFQGWQSCASCHPGQARADALNWDLLNDGIGNPKNTKSLVASHRTPPAMSRGIRDRAETAVRSGLRHIQFTLPREEDAEALDAYLKSLAPVPSPHRIAGDLSPSARRGERLFERAGCAACHPAPLYTDLRAYDVGTGRGDEKEAAFDTPTLLEVWRTAPYLHDGRAADLRDLLTRHNREDRHGATSAFTPQEIEDLAEFVLSL